LRGPLPRVLVLGGTGHIGAAIAHGFADIGHVVSAAGRSTAARANLAGSQITQLSGDDSDPQTLSHWCKGAEIIVDAATSYPLWRHGQTARGVVGAARKRNMHLLGLVQRQEAALIHISSFTTLPAEGGVKNGLQLAALRGMHPYFELKEAVERDVLRALAQGMQGSVINPAACFGPYDLKPAEQAYIPMLMQGKVAGTVGQMINVIDVRDLAHYVVASVQTGFRARQVPVFGHNIAMDTLTRGICGMGGVTPPRIKAPMMMGVAGAYLTESIVALSGRKAPWPSLPMLLAAAGQSRRQSAEQSALGVSLRPLSETLADALAWYRHIGHC
jgi:dihydroflavonol-4-reductase